jgi:hypothetical protein
MLRVMAAKKSSRSKKPEAEKRAKASPQLRWFLHLRFVDRDWVSQRANTDAIVEALAGTPLWGHLDQLGAGSGVSAPRGNVAAVKKTLASGKARYHFVRGEATAITLDRSEAWVAAEVSPRSVLFTSCVRGGVLAELGARALDSFVQLATGLHDALRGKAHVTQGFAWPAVEGRIHRPSRNADWQLLAIVDILEPTRPAAQDPDFLLEAARAIAGATAPPEATSTRHGELLILRWLDDPSDLAAADAAAARRERWLIDQIETTPLDD